MNSASVILRSAATKNLVSGRISFRESEGANFEQNETLRYAQGDIRHRKFVQSVAEHYKILRF